jgi:hypothetical protein
MRVNAERAVAAHDDDLPPGIEERRRDAEWRADAEAAERAGIEIGARRLEAEAREAQDVATVGDRDRIGFSTSRSAAKMRFGCMWPSLPAARWRDLSHASTSAARAPSASRSSTPHRAPSSLGRIRECGQREARMRTQLDLAARFSRSSSALSAMRIHCAFGRTAGEP